MFTDLNVFVKSNPDQLKLWEEAKDNFLCKLLDVGLNNVPKVDKEFSSMNEQEFNTWLKKVIANGIGILSEYKFKSAAKKSEPTEATKTLILLLSLEDNSTVSGTASVLEDFGRQFKVPCVHAKVAMQYNESLEMFGIEAVRKHYEFLYLLQEHKKEMEQLQMQLRNIEKELDDSNSRLVMDEGCNEEAADADVNGTNISFQKINGKFKKCLITLHAKCG